MKSRAFKLIAAICILLAAQIWPADANHVHASILLSERHGIEEWNHPNCYQATRRRRRSRRKTITTSSSPDSGVTPEKPPLAERSKAPASQGPLSAITYELPIRKPAVGQEQIQGLLTRVDCPAREVIFHITAGSIILNLRTASLNSVYFTTYTPDVAGDITCGVRNPVNMVVVTFRPAKDPRAKSNGDLIAVEFVPKSFELRK